MTYRLAFVSGATSGIGQATCQLLAKKGIPIIATGRNEAKLLELKQTLSNQVRIQTIQADLSKITDRQEVIALIHQCAPDLVINNAGFGLYGEALTYSTQEQVSILEVNGQAV